MNTLNPKAIVAEVGKLVSFPATTTRVLELLDDVDSATIDVANALNLDPGLAARVLRIANSAYYAMVAEVETVARAVSVLGRARLRELTVGISAVRAFEGIPLDVIAPEDFWSHSILCAALAREIAQLSRPESADLASTAGLLHDVGQLAMFMQAPAEMEQALMFMAEHEDEISMAEAEVGVLGFDHMQVGWELAQAWSLPSSLTQTIAHHHRPSEAESHEWLVATVHIANSCAVLVETDCTDLESSPPIEAAAWTSAGVGEEAVLECIGRVDEQFQAMKTALFDTAA